MSIRQSLNNIREKFYNLITSYTFVKYCGFIVIIGYISLLIIGVIVAALLDPDGYTIWNNWISDLGGIDHTPAPFLYDIACIIAGSMTLPFTFYMENLLAPLPKKNQLNRAHYSRLRFRLSSFAFLFSFIGNFGYIGVGIFSADRNYKKLSVMGQGPHDMMSFLAFGGFTLGAFFMGWLIVLYNTKIPKILGIYGIFGPITFAIINLIESTPLLEWILLLSILIWIIPLFLIVLQKPELIRSVN
ncbi:MAG: DUF998 domain-containing protein [Promethearchaeota archaeon]